MSKRTTFTDCTRQTQDVSQANLTPGADGVTIYAQTAARDTAPMVVDNDGRLRVNATVSGLTTVELSGYAALEPANVRAIVSAIEASTVENVAATDRLERSIAGLVEQLVRLQAS